MILSPFGGRRDLAWGRLIVHGSRVMLDQKSYDLLDRKYAYRTISFINNGQMAMSAGLHAPYGQANGFARLDGNGILGHHVQNWQTKGLADGQDSSDQVSFRKYADELTRFANEYTADILPSHEFDDCAHR